MSCLYQRHKLKEKYYTFVMTGFFKKHFLSLCLMFSLSVWSLWPILKDPVRRTADAWDGVLMAWYLNQTINKIPNNLGHLFQGNIFFPYKNTMAYSDMFVLSAFVNALPVKIFKEPVIAISSSLLFGQVTTAFILYLWFYEMCKNRLASFLASISLCFSGIRMGILVHLQMWNMQWLLISSFLYYKFIKSKKNIFAYISFLFLGLQMWESPLGVYFALLIILLISLFNTRYLRENWKVLFTSSLLLLLIAALPTAAYFSVSREFNYVRTIRDAANFSIGFDKLIKVFVYNPIFYIFLFSVYFLRKKVKKLKDLAWVSLVIISGLILAMGPVIKWGGKTLKIFGKIPIPLPYSVAYYLIPGFKAFRTPDRWMHFAVLGMAFVIALALSGLLRNKKISLRLKIVIVISVFFGSLLNARVKNYYIFQKVSEYPEVYSVLRKMPGGVVLELPISGEMASNDAHRMVYSLYYDKYMLGGESGFHPPSWDEIRIDSSSQFPSLDFGVKLKQNGVKYIVVWKSLYTKDRVEEIQNWGRDYNVYEDDDYLLLDLENSS